MRSIVRRHIACDPAWRDRAWPDLAWPDLGTGEKRAVVGVRQGGLPALVAAEAVAVAGLHRLGTQPWAVVGWRDPAGWLVATPLDDVVAATLRWVALTCAYWVLITTLLYLGAVLSRLPAAVRAIRWATLPAVRRVADRALTAALVAVAATAPATAAWSAPPATDLIQLQYGPPIPPAPTPARPAEGEAPRAAATSTPESSGPHRAVHMVAPGDNLWTISAAVLSRRRGGGHVHEREVASYWRRVVEINQGRLRSGDPDLIYPRDRVLLPPIP